MFEVHEFPNWNEAQLPAFHDDERRLRGLILGAGLSIAANPESPDWSTLVEKLVKHLEVETEASNPNTMLYEITQRFPHLEDRVLAARIQDYVAGVLEEAWPESGEDRKANDRRIDELSKELGRVILQSRCDVIIDLNYDDVAERILEKNEIDYYRIVGSQIDVMPPLPYSNNIVLWKVHGCIAHPSTIVLSPDDYRQIYDTNALGKHLETLATRLSELIAVGLGLTSDSVWKSLRSTPLRSEHLWIIGLWLSDRWKKREAEERLEPWHRTVLPSRCTILTAPKPEEGDTSTNLARRLGAFADRLEAHTSAPPPVRLKGLKVKDSAKSRWQSFEDDYERAYGAADRREVEKVVAEYNDDYQNLSHSIQTWQSDGLGHRALASLTREDATRCGQDPDLAGKLGADLVRVLEEASELFNQNPFSLVACCAQYIVRMVLDLVDILGAGAVETVDVWSSAPPKIQERATFLVGANPFAVPSLDRRYNLMHRVEIAHPVQIGYPLWTRTDGAGSARSSKARAFPSLTEDEWEVRVIQLYKLTKPRVRIGQQAIDLDWVPPIFPWGCRTRGLAEYRDKSTGTVTKAWHVVEETVDFGQFGRRQVTKGGSLRDTNIDCFQIAFRGLIRPGEFDDFIQHPPTTKSE